MYRKAALVIDTGLFKKCSSVTPSLSNAFVAAGCSAELFLNRAAVSFFRDTVLFLSTVAAKAEMETATNGQNHWRELVEQ